MADSSAPQSKKLHVIGFGAVGFALWRLLQKVIRDEGLPSFHAVAFWAPEIKEKTTDGVFEFNPAPFITRDNLAQMLDTVSPGVLRALRSYCASGRAQCRGGVVARHHASPAVAELTRVTLVATALHFSAPHGPAPGRGVRGRGAEDARATATGWPRDRTLEIRRYFLFASGCRAPRDEIQGVLPTLMRLLL